MLLIITILCVYSCEYLIEVPYLQLMADSTYTSGDVTISYSYKCEGDSQMCEYTLYDKTLPTDPVASESRVMSESGSISFSDLSEGDYYLRFSIYSYNNETYSLLNFLTQTAEFTVDFP
ncbi:MAG: hypothetical protein PQJ46_05610 [Spirochaetales bacterium]|nr:hypothetical protein [Spirochaetales bacterium]